MPEDAFYGSGNLGQRVVVLPSEKLVIVRLGLTHSSGFDIGAYCDWSRIRRRRSGVHEFVDRPEGNYTCVVSRSGVLSPDDAFTIKFAVRIIVS